jgi:hypothetical protein
LKITPFTFVSKIDSWNPLGDLVERCVFRDSGVREQTAVTCCSLRMLRGLGRSMVGRITEGNGRQAE